MKYMSRKQAAVQLTNNVEARTTKLIHTSIDLSKSKNSRIAKKHLKKLEMMDLIFKELEQVHNKVANKEKLTLDFMYNVQKKCLKITRNKGYMGSRNFTALDQYLKVYGQDAINEFNKNY